MHHNLTHNMKILVKNIAHYLNKDYASVITMP